MKTNKKNTILKMDERNKQVAGRVIAIMYFLTILAMQGIVLYRQFALGQDIHDFEDIAILMTVNSLFLVSALLYFGAVQIQRLKIKSILLIYAALVVLGTLFTWAKYNLFGDGDLDFRQLLDKVLIVAAIIGLILGSWILLSILGKRRTEKELDE